MDSLKKILVDADVLRHFIKGEKLDLLFEILTNEYLLVDVVHAELIKSKKVEPHITRIINEGKIKLVNFPTSTVRIRDEYFSLLNQGVDPGESACMAIARFTDDIIASSNLSDVFDYCHTHKITLLTTMDFLVIAYHKRIMTLTEIDFFIYNVTSLGSRLPNNCLKDYIERSPVICQLLENFEFSDVVANIDEEE